MQSSRWMGSWARGDPAAPGRKKLALQGHHQGRGLRPRLGACRGRDQLTATAFAGGLGGADLFCRGLDSDPVSFPILRPSLTHPLFGASPHRGSHLEQGAQARWFFQA